MSNQVITAIDVGTTKVCTLIGKVSQEGDANVIGVGIEPSKGLRKGTVVDLQETRRAVAASIKKAEQQADKRIKSAYVSVTGSHIESSNNWISIPTSTEKSVITSDRLNNMANSVQLSGLKSDRMLIHSIPLSYALDGKAGIRNPVGMHVQEMDMHTQLVTGSSSFVKTLAESVTSAGINIEGMVLQPLASGEAVLTEEEKELGVVLIDIGGGTSDIAVFQGGVLVHAAVVPVGGFQFTNDISMMFDTNYEDAEAIKLQFGNVNPEQIAIDESVVTKIIGENREVTVPRREICQVLKERAVELFSFVRAKLDKASLKGMPVLRIVLTGGASNLPGLDELARRSLTATVRIGIPMSRDVAGEDLENPAYSTSVGVLQWGARGSSHASSSKNGHNKSSNLYKRVRDWLLGQMKGLVPA